MLRSLAAALVALASPVAASAQTAPAPAPAPVPAPALDPARLAAAQALIAKVMPADRRDAMVDQMVRPVMENMRTTMLDGPAFAKLRAKDPKFGATFDAFIAGELDHSLATTKAAMPALFEAMARAYARRFTLEQLQAIGAFYDSPAGRAFVEQMPGLMSDPDILAAQRAMMNDAMTGMAQRIEAFAAKAEASAKAD